ncbi:MAG: 30S ribosomal protein S17 [Bradymonadaceae bacterium]
MAEEEQIQEDETSEDGRRKTRTGQVSSAAMDKTIVVTVTRKYMHETYKKYVRDRKRFKAHDEDNECKVGDKVLIEETRPISKDKHWRVLEILEEAPVV